MFRWLLVTGLVLMVGLLPQLLVAQITIEFDDAPDGMTDFSTSTDTYKGLVWENFGVINAGDGAVVNTTAFDGSEHSITVDGGGTFTVSELDLVEEIPDNTVTLRAYINGSQVGSNMVFTGPQTNVSLPADFQDMDEMTVTFGESETSSFGLHLDEMVVTIPTNTAPTASDNTITVAENGGHEFAAAAFNFSDADGGDALTAVDITTLPATGALYLDANDNDTNDDVAISAGDDITITDINAGRLRFEPAAGAYGKGYTSFTFKVSDGTDFSATANTMTIDVHAADIELSGTVGKNGWRMLGTPRTDDTYSGLLDNLWTQGATSGADVTAGGANVYTWDEASSDWTVVTDLTVTISNGRGFVTYVYEDDDFENPGVDGGWPKTLTPGGSSDKTGTTTFALTRNGSGADAGFNLVSNPYPFAVDWDDPDWTKTNISSPIYIWDPNANSGNGQYILWDGGSGDITGGVIAPFQAFWVEALSGTNALEVTEDVGVGTAGTFYKEKRFSGPELVLNLEGEQFSDKAWFKFSEGGSMEKDRYDALELTPLSSEYMLLYSVSVDQKNMAMNRLPLDLSEVKELPVEVAATFNGMFTLGVEEMKNIPPGWSFKLSDNLTGESWILNPRSSYRFKFTGNAVESMQKASGLLTGGFSPVLDNRNMRKGNSRFTLTVNPGIEEVPTRIPDRYTLAQNYPNPFNPTTRIQYGVPQPSNVRLTIYNVAGQKMVVLVDGERTPGTYTIEWDARGAASGIYYYRLEIGSQVLTRAMTFIK